MIIVSACLAGFNCRYDGKSKPNKKLVQLVKEGKAIPVCPEQLGGLPTPRGPFEKVGDKVLKNDGTDATFEFKKGAKKALAIAIKHHCKKAILAARSPSCGSGKIYDGTFSSKLKKGDGVCAELFKEKGIKVLTNEQI